MEIQTKNNLVGFVWQKTPVMSQYLLQKESKDGKTFEQWCKESIEQYHKSYNDILIDTKNEIEHLDKLGCYKTIVAPEPVGKTRYLIFKRLVSELPKNTFILVKSFAGFGCIQILKECMDLASEKNIYLITEQHLSLMILPENVRDEVYRNWVYKSNCVTSRTRRTRVLREKALELIENGMTYDNAQNELGVSRSTFYRLLADGKKASN